MDWNAYRDDNGTDQAEPCRRPAEPEPYEPYGRPPGADEPETYWRRRAVTLAGGLLVLGLLAWALSGGGGGKTPATTAQNSPVTGTLSATAGPSPSPQAPAQSSSAVSASHKTASARSAGESTGKSADAKSTVAAAAPAPVEPGGRCAPGSVVLSLFSGSRSYTAGQDPQFGVDAVSTAPGTCTVQLGPAQLHLVVMSAGRVIWDSADCARGDGTGLTRLTRGVPVQESFTWNRSITLPGCVTLASSARAGSYSAQARTAAVSSGVYAFRLVR